MPNMDAVQLQLLKEAADLHGVPEGAYNLRANGRSVGRDTTANIDITTKTEASGIDNCGTQDSEHDGIHRSFIGKNSRVRYVENHYGSGDGSGKRILDPVTEVHMEEGSTMEMEMVQIKGVDPTPLHCRRAGGGRQADHPREANDPRPPGRCQHLQGDTERRRLQR